MNVLVTGVAGGGVGEQIIKALRLSDIKYHILGTDTNSFSKGIFECDSYKILPPASNLGYIDNLLELCKKEKIKVIFPGSEDELKMIGKYRDSFNGIFLPINSNEVLRTCFDKMETNNFLNSNGFLFPKTVTILSPTFIPKLTYFPVVIKPKSGGRGSSNVFIAQDPKELKMVLTYLLRECGEVLVQEYIGTPEDEYTIGVLSSMNGEIINSIGVRRILSGLSNKIKVKNRTQKKELGEYLQISSGISQGEIGEYKEICNQCEKIAISLNSKGAINIQCRVINNQVYVFEINPRFSGTTSFRAMVGYNEPDILIRKHVLGENIEKSFSYKSGFIMRGLNELFVKRLN